MGSLTMKRFLAFGLDYLLGLVYGVFLFFATIWIDSPELTVGEAQLIGFLTLTLPVFLYFYLMERSKYKATIGKRLMGLSVYSKGSEDRGILLRNILKFLPWEIAHAGVHWITFYTHQNLETPLWVWVLLILPQGVLLFYIGSIILSKGKSSLYDRIAKTEMQRKDRATV